MLSEWDAPLSYDNYDGKDKQQLVELNNHVSSTELGRRELMKRQGLVPFPRVGRSGGLNPRFYHQQQADYNKRGMSGASPSASHMWFGPRLGKRAHDQGEQF